MPSYKSNNNERYYIAYDALTITANYLGNKNIVGVSMTPGTVVKVFDNRYTFFLTSANGSYKQWVLRGYTTHLGNDSEKQRTIYVYIRIHENNSTEADIIFSSVMPEELYTKEYDTPEKQNAYRETLDEGYPAYYKIDKQDKDSLNLGESATLDEYKAKYHYIHIGTMKYSSDSYSLEYDTGRLGTDIYKEESTDNWYTTQKSEKTVDFANGWKFNIFKSLKYRIQKLTDSSKSSDIERVLTSDASNINESNGSFTASSINIKTDAALPTSGWILGPFLTWLRSKFVRKDNKDGVEVIEGAVEIKKGLTVGADVDNGETFLQLGGKLSPGVQGAGAYKDDSGNIHIDADYLDVHKKFSAKEVEIQELSYIGGVLVLTPADGFKVVKVVKLNVNEAPLTNDSETPFYYDLLWHATDEDGTDVYNQWQEGHQAMCQVFSSYANENTDIGKHGEGINTKFWWSLVVAKWHDYNYEGEKYNAIRVSFKDGECVTTDTPPAIGDRVVMMGHQKQTGETDADAARFQAAITQAAAGGAAPYIRIYEGIGAGENPFTMPDGNDIGTQLKPGDNRFTGEVHIQGNSTINGDTTFIDFYNQMMDAAKNGNSALETISTLKFGVSNLLRNSGFTGDYLSENISEGEELKETSEMYSPSMQRWDVTGNVHAVSNDSVSSSDKFSGSESGSLCEMEGATAKITQTLYWKTTNEDYVFSLYAKRRSSSYSNNNIVVTISNGKSDTTIATFTPTDTWQRFEQSFKLQGGVSLSVAGDAFITQLQLEKGTSATGWTLCSLDNTSEMAMYNALKYISYALNEDTLINGGLILSSLIQLGSKDDGGNKWECRAGVNGTITHDEETDRDTSPAFWAGGDLDAACYASRFYKDVNLNGVPVPDANDAAQMANVVITHGGRAILRDAVVRGKVYAESGEFGGELKSATGDFSGTVKANAFYLNNAKSMATQQSNEYVLNPAEDGTTMFTGCNGITFYLPLAATCVGLQYTFVAAKRIIRSGIAECKIKVAEEASGNTTEYIFDPTFYEGSSSSGQKKEVDFLWGVMQLISDGTDWIITSGATNY